MSVLRQGERSGGDELFGTLVFGVGLAVAAGLNFAFSSLMGRMLAPPAFGTLGVLIAALIAIIGPINALSGGTEMFAALHDRFPRGRKRLIAPAIGLLLWGVSMFSTSAAVRSAGWFALGAAALVLLAWNRGALVGLGRFSFVGVSFVVEGAARLALPVALVAMGLGLEGASAGFVVGMLIALALTEVAVPRVSAGTKEPLGRDVWLALFGLFALGLTQIVDVFAVRLANPGASASYVAAASLARIALFSQMPAAAYALRRAALDGPRKALRRTLPLSIVPGVVAIAVIELFPELLLRIAYGNRFLSSVGTLRILGIAMLLGGLATVTAQLLMGRGSTAWALSMVPVSIVGTVLMITLTHAPTSVAIFSVALQGCALLAVVLPAVAALRQPDDGRDGRDGVLILNWRDRKHPQGGGSEVYVEQLASRLARSGRSVTVFCAAHPNAPRAETVDGVRFVRRGGWRTVYAWAFLYHLFGRLGPHAVVIDVKNGIPFFAPLYCRHPVVCLVHHIHREQWRMNFSPRQARLGWWIESKLSTRLYGRTMYVAVSQSTKRELCDLGVRPEMIEVIHNGSDVTPPAGVAKAPVPTVAFLGRLVPHKRVEMVLDAAATLSVDIPNVEVQIIGSGPWESRLREHAVNLGIDDRVVFAGWTQDEAKLRMLCEAWVLGLPSVKEGWGLVVMEAAACRTPTVAFRVGGLEESIQDGITGLLVEHEAGFAAGLRSLLLDAGARARMGEAARAWADTYPWEATAERFDLLLRRLAGREAVVPIYEALAETVPTAPEP